MTGNCAVVKHPRIPTCTYRLQFNRWSTFAQAREIVAYLHKLGVSDVYASPYFQASPDSLHGYDITDHNKLNPAVASRADYDAWITQLHAHGMSHVLDLFRITSGLPIHEMSGGWTCWKTDPAQDLRRISISTGNR